MKAGTRPSIMNSIAASNSSELLTSKDVAFATDLWMRLWTGEVSLIKPEAQRVLLLHVTSIEPDTSEACSIQSVLLASEDDVPSYNRLALHGLRKCANLSS